MANSLRGYIRSIAQCSRRDFFCPYGDNETTRYCLYCSISRYQASVLPLEHVQRYLNTRNRQRDPM